MSITILNNQEALAALSARIGSRNVDILVRRAVQHQLGLELMVEPYARHPHVLVPMKNTYHPMNDDPVQQHYDLSDQFCAAIDRFVQLDAGNPYHLSKEKAFSVMGARKPLTGIVLTPEEWAEAHAWKPED